MSDFLRTFVERFVANKTERERTLAILGAVVGVKDVGFTRRGDLSDEVVKKRTIDGIIRLSRTTDVARAQEQPLWYFHQKEVSEPGAVWKHKEWTTKHDIASWAASAASILERKQAKAAGASTSPSADKTRSGGGGSKKKKKPATPKTAAEKLAAKNERTEKRNKLAYDTAVVLNLGPDSGSVLAWRKDSRPLTTADSFLALPVEERAKRVMLVPREKLRALHPAGGIDLSDTPGGKKKVGSHGKSASQTSGAKRGTASRIDAQTYTRDDQARTRVVDAASGHTLPLLDVRYAAWLAGLWPDEVEEGDTDDDEDGGGDDDEEEEEDSDDEDKDEDEEDEEEEKEKKDDADRMDVDKEEDDDAGDGEEEGEDEEGGDTGSGDDEEDDDDEEEEEEEEEDADDGDPTPPPSLSQPLKKKTKSKKKATEEAGKANQKRKKMLLMKKQLKKKEMEKKAKKAAALQKAKPKKKQKKKKKTEEGGTNQKKKKNAVAESDAEDEDAPKKKKKKKAGAASTSSTTPLTAAPPPSHHPAPTVAHAPLAAPTKQSEKTALMVVANFEDELARRMHANVARGTVDAHERRIVGFSDKTEIPKSWGELFQATDPLRRYLIFPSKGGAPVRLPWGLFIHEWPEARQRLLDFETVGLLVTKLEHAEQRCKQAYADPAVAAAATTSLYRPFQMGLHQSVVAAMVAAHVSPPTSVTFDVNWDQARIPRLSSLDCYSMQRIVTQPGSRVYAQSIFWYAKGRDGGEDKQYQFFQRRFDPDCALPRFRCMLRPPPLVSATTAATSPLPPPSLMAGVPGGKIRVPNSNNNKAPVPPAVTAGRKRAKSTTTPTATIADVAAASPPPPPPTHSLTTTHMDLTPPPPVQETAAATTGPRTKRARMDAAPLASAMGGIPPTAQPPPASAFAPESLLRLPKDARPSPLDVGAELHAAERLLFCRVPAFDDMLEALRGLDAGGFLTCISGARGELMSRIDDGGIAMLTDGPALLRDAIDAAAQGPAGMAKMQAFLAAHAQAGPHGNDEAVKKQNIKTKRFALLLAANFLRLFVKERPLPPPPPPSQTTTTAAEDRMEIVLMDDGADDMAEALGLAPSATATAATAASKTPNIAPPPPPPPPAMPSLPDAPSSLALLLLVAMPLSEQNAVWLTAFAKEHEAALVEGAAPVPVKNKPDLVAAFFSAALDADKTPFRAAGVRVYDCLLMLRVLAAACLNLPIRKLAATDIDYSRYRI